MLQRVQQENIVQLVVIKQQRQQDTAMEAGAITVRVNIEDNVRSVARIIMEATLREQQQHVQQHKNVQAVHMCMQQQQDTVMEVGAITVQVNIEDNVRSVVRIIMEAIQQEQQQHVQQRKNVQAVHMCMQQQKGIAGEAGAITVQLNTEDNVQHVVRMVMEVT